MNFNRVRRRSWAGVPAILIAMFSVLFAATPNGAQSHGKPVPPPPPPPPLIGCVDPSRELTVVALSVVDSTLRATWNTDPSVDPRAAAWTFGRLMQKIAGPNDPQVMVRTMLDTWVTNQVVNGQTIAARPKMQTEIIAPWLAASGTKKQPATTLDLKKAPFKLNAIVARLDLRDLTKHSAGQGRFVFSVLENGNIAAFTVILEYNLYATDQAGIDQWARDWHALGSLVLGSAVYNDALGAITDRFTNTGALLSFRSEDATLDPLTENIATTVPEFRQFQLNAAGTRLDPAPLDQTPMNAANGTTRLADFINQNQAYVLDETFVVPPTFQSAPFQAGSIFASLGGSTVNNFWNAPSIINPDDTRQKFSLNTCNGCHAAETGTGIIHLDRKNVSTPAVLSGFLTGITVADPVTGTNRTFNKLADRAHDLSSMVCP